MRNLMKIIFVSLTLSNFEGKAQESIIGDVNYSTLEKYIEAAKENFPRKKIYKSNIDVAKSNVTANTLSYLDILNVSYFYRPDEGTSLNPTNPYTVNGFQYGANLNLGNFLQKTALGKRAKAELKIAELESKEYDNTLSYEVKKRYFNYIRLLKDLKIKTQISQDNEGLVQNLSRRFEKGEIQLENLNVSRIRAADANTQKIQVEADLFVAKDALEEIIGLKLSDIK